MCQITAPPTVFLAVPLQAPGWWLLIVGFLAFGVVLAPYTYREYLRQHPSALYRRVGLALLGGALLLVCTGAVLLALVVLPSRDALSAWMGSQYESLTASHCPETAYATLFDTYDRQRNGPIATLDVVGKVFMIVGIGFEFIWVYWLHRRPRPQPARQ
jgi:hypothetical protein